MDSQLEQAERLFQDGYPSQALQLLQEQLSFKPSSAPLHFALGRLYYGLGLLKEALEHLYQSDNPEAWRLMAQAYELQRRHRQAVLCWFEYLSRFSAQFPNQQSVPEPCRLRWGIWGQLDCNTHHRYGGLTLAGFCSLRHGFDPQCLAQTIWSLWGHIRIFDWSISKVTTPNPRLRDLAQLIASGIQCRPAGRVLQLYWDTLEFQQHYPNLVGANWLRTVAPPLAVAVSWARSHFAPWDEPTITGVISFAVVARGPRLADRLQGGPDLVGFFSEKPLEWSGQLVNLRQQLQRQLLTISSVRDFSVADLRLHLRPTPGWEERRSREEEREVPLASLFWALNEGEFELLAAHCPQGRLDTSLESAIWERLKTCPPDRRQSLVELLIGSNPWHLRRLWQRYPQQRMAIYCGLLQGNCSCIPSDIEKLRELAHRLVLAQTDEELREAAVYQLQDQPLSPRIRGRLNLENQLERELHQESCPNFREQLAGPDPDWDKLGRIDPALCQHVALENSQLFVAWALNQWQCWVTVPWRLDLLYSLASQPLTELALQAPPGEPVFLVLSKAQRSDRLPEAIALTHAGRAGLATLRYLQQWKAPDEVLLAWLAWAPQALDAALILIERGHPQFWQILQTEYLEGLHGYLEVTETLIRWAKPEGYDFLARQERIDDSLEEAYACARTDSQREQVLLATHEVKKRRRRL